MEFKKMVKRHPLLIPSGEFCYRMWSNPPELCPYWVETAQGSILCVYLNVEVPPFSEEYSYLADMIKECDVRRG